MDWWKPKNRKASVAEMQKHSRTNAETLSNFWFLQFSPKEPYLKSGSSEGLRRASVAFEIPYMVVSCITLTVGWHSEWSVNSHFWGLQPWRKGRLGGNKMSTGFYPIVTEHAENRNCLVSNSLRVTRMLSWANVQYSSLSWFLMWNVKKACTIQLFKGRRYSGEYVPCL